VGSNTSVRKGSGISERRVTISDGSISLSLALVDLVDGRDGVRGGDLLEGRSTGSIPDWVVGIGDGCISVSDGGIGLSLALVDLAHGGDGEGGGDLLEGRSTGSIPDWVVGIGKGSIAVTERSISLGLALSNVVTSGGIPVPVSAGCIPIPISEGCGISSVSISRVWSNSVSIGGSVKERSIGLSLSLSSHNGGANCECNNGLKFKIFSDVRIFHLTCNFLF
jgi:hypothetical protein